MGRKLYVGNLPYTVGEAELQAHFAQAGGAESVTVMRGQMSARARGLGVVGMATDQHAQTAIDTLNARDFGGRRLTVNEARPKESRSGSGSGGGFGGGGGGK